MTIFTTDTFRAYKPYIAQPLLSAEEERTLAERVATGDTVAREELVMRNVRLVVKQLAKVNNNNVEDLFQEGMAGLVTAVDRFDTSHDTRFSTYATYWIQKHIVDAKSAEEAIHRPDYVHSEMVRVRKYSEEFQKRTGREPTFEELSLHTPLSDDLLRAALMADSVASVDAPVSEDSLSLAEVLSDGVDPSEELINQMGMKEKLNNLLLFLPPRERIVLEMRYGLSSVTPYSLQEVGDALGLTRERVRQLEVTGLKRLRYYCIARRISEFD